MKASINRKVVNAHPNTYDGMEFKSRLETQCYRMLVESGYSPEYEKTTIVISKGFNPSAFNLKCFCPMKDRKTKERKFMQDNRSMGHTTYTPDFMFTKNGNILIFEVKGMPNDVYPVKKKLALESYCRQFKDTGSNIYFFEVHSMNDIKDAIAIVDNL